MQEAKNYIAETQIIDAKPIETFVDNSKEIKRKLEKLKDLYINDLIDKNMYETDYKKYKNQLQELESKKDNYKKTTTKDFSKLKKIFDSDFKNLYLSLSRIEKRKFWLSIIDKIYYKDKKIEKIVFK